MVFAVDCPINKRFFYNIIEFSKIKQWTVKLLRKNGVEKVDLFR